MVILWPFQIWIPLPAAFWMSRVTKNFPLHLRRCSYNFPVDESFPFKSYEAMREALTVRGWDRYLRVFATCVSKNTFLKVVESWDSMISNNHKFNFRNLFVLLFLPTFEKKILQQQQICGVNVCCLSFFWGKPFQFLCNQKQRQCHPSPQRRGIMPMLKRPEEFASEASILSGISGSPQMGGISGGMQLVVGLDGFCQWMVLSKWNELKLHIYIYNFFSYLRIRKGYLGPVNI